MDSVGDLSRLAWTLQLLYCFLRYVYIFVDIGALMSRLMWTLVLFFKKISYRVEMSTYLWTVLAICLD